MGRPAYIRFRRILAPDQDAPLFPEPSLPTPHHGPSFRRASPISGTAIGLTQAQVNGHIYSVDAGEPAVSLINPALLLTVKGDLTTACNAAAGRTPFPAAAFLNPGAGNLGGLNLGQGLFKITSTTLISGPDLTLTGGVDDVWTIRPNGQIRKKTSTLFPGHSGPAFSTNSHSQRYERTRCVRWTMPCPADPFRVHSGD